MQLKKKCEKMDANKNFSLLLYQPNIMFTVKITLLWLIRYNEVTWRSTEVTWRSTEVTWRSTEVTWRSTEVTWRSADVTWLLWLYRDVTTSFPFPLPLLLSLLTVIFTVYKVYRKKIILKLILHRYVFLKIYM